MWKVSSINELSSITLPRTKYSPGLKRPRMSSGASSSSVTCSKGHVHPPWNTSGILRIAKCESVCGFCHKETKTAANLRKHVAIHIKNEGLNLKIAEGSSGRGRLEMPVLKVEAVEASSSQSQFPNEEELLQRQIPLQPPMTTLAKRHQVTLRNEPFSSSSVPNKPEDPSLLVPGAMASNSHLSCAVVSSSCHQPSRPFTTILPLDYPNPSDMTDPFRRLRDNNLKTKIAWTVIPASEGFRILDLCKSLSVASSTKPPCYNRETIFDEEWQAHMKDVHGLFLLWPETWMRRIEVLDLDPFNGDIGVCNEVIMEVGE